MSAGSRGGGGGGGGSGGGGGGKRRRARADSEASDSNPDDVEGIDIAEAALALLPLSRPGTSLSPVAPWVAGPAPGSSGEPAAVAPADAASAAAAGANAILLPPPFPEVGGGVHSSDPTGGGGGGGGGGMLSALAGSGLLPHMPSWMPGRMGPAGLFRSNSLLPPSIAPLSTAIVPTNNRPRAAMFPMLANSSRQPSYEVMALLQAAGGAGGVGGGVSGIGMGSGVGGGVYPTSPATAMFRVPSFEAPGYGLVPTPPPPPHTIAGVAGGGGADIDALLAPAGAAAAPPPPPTPIS